MESKLESNTRKSYSYFQFAKELIDFYSEEKWTFYEWNYFATRS